MFILIALLLCSLAEVRAWCPSRMYVGNNVEFLDSERNTSVSNWFSVQRQGCINLATDTCGGAYGLSGPDLLYWDPGVAFDGRAADPRASVTVRAANTAHLRDAAYDNFYVSAVVVRNSHCASFGCGGVRRLELQVPKVNGWVTSNATLALTSAVWETVVAADLPDPRNVSCADRPYLTVYTPSFQTVPIVKDSIVRLLVRSSWDVSVALEYLKFEIASY